MDGLQYTSQQKRRKEKEIPPQNFIIQEELGFFYWNVTLILGLLNKLLLRKTTNSGKAKIAAEPTALTHNPDDLSDYEKKREARMEANQEVLRELRLA